MSNIDYSISKSNGIKKSFPIFKVEIEAIDKNLGIRLESFYWIHLPQNLSLFALKLKLTTTKRFSKANKESLMLSLVGDGKHVSLELNSNLDNVYTYEDAFKKANTNLLMM
ncbi:hypothetical protein EPI10_017052 [Gossypium australe]|uniref:Uncharacterized protein n=1 Tax=Gossypium australe TaxID=47621 RepID=A0A5B6VR05_9ROSI|nr:hypothetical protein EPI10_017052 [Gossypium australe]